MLNRKEVPKLEEVWHLCPLLLQPGPWKRGSRLRSKQSKTVMYFPCQGRHRPVLPAPERLVGSVSGDVPGPGAAPPPSSQALLPPGNLAREGNYFTLLLCSCVREGHSSLKGGSWKFILVSAWININWCTLPVLTHQGFFCLLYSKKIGDADRSSLCGLCLKHREPQTAIHPLLPKHMLAPGHPDSA